jgi:hypothetical protein
MQAIRRIGFALLIVTLPGTGRGEEIIAPQSMRAIGTIDVRFQSYNVEMVEVTGGRFWKPYAQGGMQRDRYAYRPPIDLSNARLRKLAAALGPAYMRISGTWANATFFADTDSPPTAPPAGFDTVLSRTQWRGAIAFAHATNSEIVTSFAVSPGSRRADGVWTQDSAQGSLTTRAGSAAASPPPNSCTSRRLRQPTARRRDMTRRRMAATSGSFASGCGDRHRKH